MDDFNSKLAQYCSNKYLNWPSPVFGRFQNGCNKVVIEPRVVQFWSEIILVISAQIALHSVQLPLWIPSMVKTIVKLVLSEASNFDLMYTVMEVAVEHSGIFTSLCRQGTEIFHDDVEKVLSDFVYPLRQNRRFIWVKTSKWSSKYFLWNRTCIARGGSERYTEIEKKKKKASPRLFCLSALWQTSRLLANHSAHISGISGAILIILILNHDDNRSLKLNTSPSISLFIQMNSFFALPYVRLAFQIISLSSLNYLCFSSIFLSFIFHRFFSRCCLQSHNCFSARGFNAQ